MKIYTLLAIISFILGLFWLTVPFVSETYITLLKFYHCSIAKGGGIAAILFGFLSFLLIDRKVREKEIFLAIFGIMLGILAVLLACP